MMAQHISTSTSTNNIRTISVPNSGNIQHHNDNMTSAIIIDVSIYLFIDKKSTKMLC